MNNQRILVGICGVMVIALLLVGCSSGAPTTSPAGVDQQENLPAEGSGQPESPPPASDISQETGSSAMAEEEAATPASSVEQEIVPSATDVDEEDAPAVIESQEETSPPAVVAEPMTGPSVDGYAPRTTNGVDVIYFEPTGICACTAAVGDAVEMAVLTYFQDELQSGELRYFFVVSNDPVNRDLVYSFDSQPLELQIVEFKDGQMKNEAVNEIWTLKSSPATIVEFVHARVLSSLGAQQ